MEYEGGDDNNVEVGVKTPLEGNGDFRNKECLDLLDECDIVVTNEPFSLFREYVGTLMQHGKKFLIIGNKNAITYKEFFPLLKENKVWIGYSSPSEFDTPNGMTKKINGLTRWFTNLDIQKRHEKLILWQRYYDDDGNPLPDVEERYPHYFNYDGINVDKVADIPTDYQGVIGVPITFLDKYNPEQFEIVGMSATAETMDTPVQLGDDFIKEYRQQGGTGHFSPNMYGVCYFDSRGKAKVPYGRILIKSRKEAI